MQIGDKEHRAKFIEDLKTETQTNIWKNELHLLRIDDEIGLLRKEIARIDLEVEQKGKPAANAEKKARFSLEQNIAHKEREKAQVEEAKKYNEYLLNDLLPRYEEQGRSAK